MALKDEPSPKCAFLTATAALGVTAAAATATAAAAAPGSKTPWSCGRNVPSQKACCWCGKYHFFTILLISFLPYCYCCCWTHMLPLLLPRPLLWLLLQLPAAKHHGPKGRTESKIYVSRGRNVPSEILQKACRCYCHGRCCGCCCSSRQQNTMALKDEPSPKCTFPGAGTSFLKSYKKLAAATATAAALAAAAAPGSKTPWPSRTNRVQNICFPGPERPF